MFYFFIIIFLIKKNQNVLEIENLGIFACECVSVVS